MIPEPFKLPEPSPIGTGRRVPAREGPPAPGPPPPDDATLREYVWTVVERWRTVATVLAAALAAGLLYVVAATPVYHADAIVQVEPRSRGPTGLEEVLLQGALGPAETEIALIRSRSSLAEVVASLGLDVVVTPRRFPLLGGVVARRWRGEEPRPAPLGLRRFAWGGERVAIGTLEVPEPLLDRRMILTVGERGRYRLAYEGATVLEGVAGAPGTGRYEGRPAEALVTELVARPGTEFTVVKRRRARLVGQLQQALRIAENGRLSGILVVSLDGTDPVKTAAILDAVANNYVRQNVDRKAAEAAQQLAFLESQLPVVKKSAAAAEAALNEFLRTHRSANLSREGQSLLERAATIERDLSGLELQASELRQRFMPNHPAFASLNEKLHLLRVERAAINQRTQELPQAEAEYARLQRDLRVSTELYNVLLNKSQELRILKSGTIGNVRVVDPPIVPDRPAWPRTGTVLALALLLGCLGGIAAAFVRKALSRGARDPDDIEASTGLPVYSAIPHSERETALRRLRRAGGSGEATVLADADPRDPAVEGLRSLRTSLQFALAEASSNVLVISGPAPGIGKSFVCVNLAAVLATAERRALVVDGDLRRGRLHRYFGLERRPGLSDVLGGAASLEAAVRRTDHPGLDVVTTGTVPPNAVELVSSHRFQALLEEVSRRYAYVLVDTPPVLAVTDAVVEARCAGVTFLVLKEGQHSLREIGLCVKRFAQNGVPVHGAVLNDVQAILGRYGRHGRYQSYEYEPDRG